MNAAPAPLKPTRAPLPRLPLVDAARGLAVAAMVLFHLVWDLSHFGLIDPETASRPAWRGFAHVIAASFLALVGVSLALWHRGGAPRGPYLWRLALVAGAAGLVTLGSWLFDPGGLILFGILHHIALASVLALPLLREPGWLALLAGAACLAAPRLAPVIEAPALMVLGLGSAPPVTNDWVPLLPWFGFVALGLGLARVAFDARPGLGRRNEAPGPAVRALARAGRWSLPVYLVHQPLLLAVLGLAALALQGPAARSPDAVLAREEAAFPEGCRSACARARGASGAAACPVYCACVAGRLKQEDLWRPVLIGPITPAQDARMRELAGVCASETRP